MPVDDRAEPQLPDQPVKRFTLLDRQAERSAIGRVLDTVREGFSGTLVLRGAPGIGKTSLLRHAVREAPDMRACAVAGVESEISREFGSLRRLLIPFLPLVGELPPPQRDALRVAFGEETGPPPERFLVGLASLTLLSLAAQQQPLLCVVDDAHWLDPESAQVLGFVGRRLHVDRVGLIVVVGEPATTQTQAFTHLPTITVDGLPDADASGLLGSVAGGPLNAQAVDRILAETHNNPLALVELGRMYTAEQLSGRATLPEPLPLGRRLEEHFLRQVRGLHPDAQVFILLAATDTEGERAPLWRAAALAGVDADAASAEAAWSGVLELSDDSVRFRYPLARSAVYYGADDAERRRAHQVLGEAGNPELRAWHLAAATTVRDEELASELQRTAERAASRGGYAARAALLRRAADLTPDDGHRALRDLTLAEATLMAGDPPRAQTVLDEALPRLTGTVTRGFAQTLQGAIRFAQGDAAEAARILAGAAQALGHDERLARDTMLGALEAAIWSGPVLTREIARLTHTVPPAVGAAPSISDLLLEGYTARFTLGYRASVEPLRAAVNALLAADLDPAVGLRWFSLGAAAAGSLWDDRGTFEISDRWVNLARATGAFTTLPVALAFHGVSDAMAGDFREADARWAMVKDVLSVSPGPAVLGASSRSNGFTYNYRGQLVEGRATGLAQVEESTARGQGGPADIGRHIAAVSDLLAGSYEAAMATAQIVVDNDPAYTAEETLPELVEAAFRAGRRETALIAYETLSERALLAGTPLGLGLRSRCAALLAEGADAEGAYLESINQLKRSRMVVDLARTHLYYGQWLRRAKRRLDAGQQLRTAYDMFAAMGAERFAEQASVELRAVGERTRARAREAALDLTPQESRVADLAAAGASNSEIAANLFVSPSTVDYHLRKVFRKLEVTSRTQLAARLTAGRRI